MVVDFADPNGFECVMGILCAKGVAVLPCDTMYGLVGVAPDTGRRIAAIKSRGEGKHFVQLIPSAAWLPRFTCQVMPPDLRGYWPGPLTIVVSGPKSGSSALRVPADRYLVDLLIALDRPLYSTSVNRSGGSPLWRIRDIVSAFEPLVDVVVDRGDRKGVASTIVDLTVVPFRLVRQGCVKLPGHLLT